MTTTVLPAASANWLLPFAATLIAMFTLQLSNLGFSPLLPSIQQEFGTSFTQLGLFTGAARTAGDAAHVPAESVRSASARSACSASDCLAWLQAACCSERRRASGRRSRSGGRRSSATDAFVSVLAIALRRSIAARPHGVLGATSALVCGWRSARGMLVGEFGWRVAILGYAAMAVVGATVFWLFYRPTSDDPRGAGAQTAHGGGSRSAFLRPLCG